MLLKNAFYGLVLGFCVSAAAQIVSFNSLDGTQIKALVFHPPSSNNDQTRRGTVVALHGCGGLYATTGSRKGQLNARHQAMADLLVAEGYNGCFSGQPHAAW